MPQLQPMPLFLNEGAGADRGLICGYRLEPHGPAREVTADGIVQALAQPDQVTWLHFNLSDQRARRWLLDAAFLPAALREVLQDHDENRRVEWTDGGLLMVISDFTYEDESDPSEVAPLWCYAGRHLLITGRVHALRAPTRCASACARASPPGRASSSPRSCSTCAPRASRCLRAP